MSDQVVSYFVEPSVFSLALAGFYAREGPKSDDLIGRIETDIDTAAPLAGVTREAVYATLHAKTAIPREEYEEAKLALVRAEKGAKFVDVPKAQGVVVQYEAVSVRRENLLASLSFAASAYALVEITPYGDDVEITLYTPIKVSDSYNLTQTEFLSTYRIMAAAIANAGDAHQEIHESHVTFTARGKRNAASGLDLESLVREVKDNALAEIGIKFSFYQVIQNSVGDRVPHGEKPPISGHGVGEASSTHVDAPQDNTAQIPVSDAVEAGLDSQLEQPAGYATSLRQGGSLKNLLPDMVHAGDALYMRISHVLRAAGIKSSGDYLEFVDSAHPGRDPHKSGYVRAAVMQAIGHQEFVRTRDIISSAGRILRGYDVIFSDLDIESAIKDMKKRGILRGEGSESTIAGSWVVPLSRMEELKSSLKPAG